MLQILMSGHRRWVLGLAAVLITLGTATVPAAGAAGRREPTARAASGRPEASPTDYADVLSGTTFPITVTSYQGTTPLGTIVLRHPATRIVVLDTGQLVDSLLYIHANVVGAPDGAFEAPSIYANMLDVRHVTEIGSRPNWDFERIAALHPDLIVANPAEFDTFYSEFEAIAPSIAVGAEAGPPGNQLPWAYYVSQFAVLTGKKAEIPAIIKKEDAAATALKPRLKGYKMALVQTFPTASKIVNCYPPLFAYLGADVDTGLKAQDCVVVDPEQLNTVTQPNILIPQSTTGNVNLTYFQQQPLYPTVPAAKQGHVYLVPSDLYYTGGPISYFDALKQIPQYLKDLPPAPKQKKKKSKRKKK